MNIAVYALTNQGLRLARKITDTLGGTLHVAMRLKQDDAIPITSLPSHMAETFTQYDGHIFIAAAGIVIRCIAPHIQSKDSDPAVICLDQNGHYAISLLSGHLGGANDLAQQCADIVGGQAVITTATDSAGLPSLDILARDLDMVIGNMDRIKVVNSALLDGNPVQIYDPGNYFAVPENKLFRFIRHPAEWEQNAPGVWISWREDCPDANALRLYPRVLMLGIGCRRGVDGMEISQHIFTVFEAAGLSFMSIGGLASIDLKSDEQGLLDNAEGLELTPKFYSKEQLDTVEAPNPSGTVMRRVGVTSVSEAAAILLSDRGELLVEKTKTQTVTLAVARRK